MLECFICCEQVLNLIYCPDCNFSCCQFCWEKYILEGKTSCINNNCKKELSRQFIFENFNKECIRECWETLKSKQYVEIENALLPMTQYRMKNKNSFEINSSLSLKKCITENCRGYIENNWQCGICLSWMCEKCFSKKDFENDENHKCSEDTIATISSLKTNTKPCPKCYIPIYKIDGCNQMWCTQCHVAFDWETGSLITKFHNPHFVEYRRKNNLYLSRDDIECDRSLDDNRLFDSLCSKFSQKKRTRNTTNCSCRIEGTNKIITGTKGCLELWEFQEDGFLYKIKTFNINNEWICGITSISDTNEFVICLLGELQIWKFENETLVKKDTLCSDEMNNFLSAICYIPKYKLLLCGGRSHYIYYWIKNDNDKFIYKGSKLQHSEHIFWISHIANSDIILSGGRDNKIVLWTYKYNILCYLKTIETNHEAIRVIYNIPKTKKMSLNRFVTTCHKYLKVWEYTDDFENIELKQSFPCYGMYFLNIPETNCYISVGDHDHNIVFWNLDEIGNFEKIFTFTNKNINFTCLYIPEINKIIIGDNNFNLYVWTFDLFLLSSIQYIFDIIKQTLHLKDVESIPFNYTPIDNEHLRILFLKNEITNQEFEKRIFKEYIENEEKQEIKLILDLQIQGITDIVFRFCNNNDINFDNYILEIQNLTEYSNNLLKEREKLYNIILPKIKYHPIDDENILSL